MDNTLFTDHPIYAQCKGVRNPDTLDNRRAQGPYPTKQQIQFQQCVQAFNAPQSNDPFAVDIHVKMREMHKRSVHEDKITLDGGNRNVIGRLLRSFDAYVALLRETTAAWVEIPAEDVALFQRLRHMDSDDDGLAAST